MGIPLILRWTWWRVTAAAELSAILASTVLAPFLLVALEADGARILAMTLATTSVVIGVSLFGVAEPPESLQRFYRRVRPPGYWGPVAIACGDDPRASVARLWKGLVDAATVAFAVFCLLVGLGSWLVGGPAPVWFPWRVAWIAGLTVGGLALLSRVGLRADSTVAASASSRPIQ
jgi:hypothetical protein